MCLIIGIAIRAVIKNNVGTVSHKRVLESTIKELPLAKTEHAINSVQSIMLAPKMLPMPISGLFSFTLVIVVTSSGKLVPTAIIIKLTNPPLMPSISLIASTLLTNTIAPNPIAKAEHTKLTTIFNHGIFCGGKLVGVLYFFASMQLITINNASTSNKNTDSVMPTLPLMPTIKSIKTVKQKYKHLTIIALEFTAVGNSKKLIPKTIVKLHTIEPTAVLIPTSLIPLKLETSETVVSGNVVAIATTVAPTTIGGIFALFAKATDASTKKSPPFKISTNPKINTIIVNALIIIKFMKLILIK